MRTIRIGLLGLGNVGSAVAGALPLDHPLARLDDEENGLLVHSDLAGELFVRGKGAGGVPTSSAILGDLASTVAAPTASSRALQQVDIVPLATIEEVLEEVEGE